MDIDESYKKMEKRTPAQVERDFKNAEKFRKKLQKFMEENDEAREYYSSFFTAH